MPAVRTENITSLKSFLDFVSGHHPQNGTVWFRGVSKATHQLVPALFRHPTAATPDALSTLEARVVDRFKQRSIPFHSRRLDDPWDALFFMQHYGVPTRLLDWTENPLFGLYFGAAYGSPPPPGQPDPDAAVWVLDPTAWNRVALKHQSFQGGPLTPSDSELSGFLPTPRYASMNVLPVALFGAHNSPRIVAQRGVFTVFGQDRTPMEEAYASNTAFPADTLIKLVLPGAQIQQFRKELFDFGITHSVVFPDLDGLAREIKVFSGFRS